MTVCIAALCGDANVVVCVADRMLSAGDIEFEPPFPKIYPLTSSIALLSAGDAALQVEITQALFYRTQGMITREPERWLTVKEVAFLYQEEYNKVFQRRAEQALLMPLGLTHETFLKNQSDFSLEFVDRITSDLRAFKTDRVSTLVVGYDQTAAHIWMLDDGDLYCQDRVGFAAVGSGAWHAESQLMFAGHTPTRDFSQTLFLSYLAKKRAEVAPGVGSATDMFVIHGLGASYFLVDRHLDVLEERYEILSGRQREAFAEASEAITNYVNEETEQAARAQNQPIAPEPLTDVVP